MSMCHHKKFQKLLSLHYQVRSVQIKANYLIRIKINAPPSPGISCLAKLTIHNPICRSPMLREHKIQGCTNVFISFSRITGEFKPFSFNLFDLNAKSQTAAQEKRTTLLLSKLPGLFKWTTRGLKIIGILILVYA